MRLTAFGIVAIISTAVIVQNSNLVQAQTGLNLFQNEVIVDYPVSVPNSQDQEVRKRFIQLLAGVAVALALGSFLGPTGANVLTGSDVGGMEDMSPLPPPS